MKVYITKYALTKGIEEKEVEICSDIDENMVKVIGVRFSECYFGEGNQWHRTLQSAIKRAEEMRIKKINSLKKQITKLENMKFE